MLTVDPGAKPGFCLSEGGEIRAITHDILNLPFEVMALDELLVEDQFATAYAYRNGKRVRISRKSQLTLVRTADRLFYTIPADRKYRMLPDAWRGILWPGARRLTKKVVLARLEKDYGHLVPASVPAKSRGDVLEAVGMNVAWCRLTPEEKERFRAK